MMPGIKAFWLDRSVREQRLLSLLGLIVVFFALWFLLCKPLIAFRADAQASYEQALQDLRILQQDAAVVSRLLEAGSRQDRFSGGAVRPEINTAAAERGIAITRVQPGADNLLTLWLDQVPATAFYDWLLYLNQQLGLEVVRSSIQSTGDGTIEAQITLFLGEET